MLTLTPFRSWALPGAGPGGGAFGFEFAAVEFVRPNARSALSAPMPIVSASLPSLNVVPTRLTARLVSVSGPIARGVLDCVASITFGSSVNAPNPPPGFCSSVAPAHVASAGALTGSTHHVGVVEFRAVATNLDLDGPLRPDLLQRDRPAAASRSNATCSGRPAALA